MKYDQEVINKIKTLRHRGYSYPEISHICKVSKTTALRHCRYEKILPQFLSRWQERRDSSSVRSKNKWAEAEQKVSMLIPEIDISHKALMVAMLYWAEGAKRELSFSNTDPVMINFFSRLLIEIFKVKKEDFKISIRVYEDLDIAKCISFWSNILQIDLINNVSINKLQGKKKGKLEFGMCRIRIKKGDLIHKQLLSIVKRADLLYVPL